MEHGPFTVSARWRQFGVRVGRLGHINVRSQSSKILHDALHDRRSDQSSPDEVERIVAQPWEMVRTVPRPASYLADYIQDRTRIACDNLSH